MSMPENKQSSIHKLPILRYIQAKYFFPKYAPAVRDWRKKASGLSGHGKPITFTEPDKQCIREGLQRMVDEEGGKV